MLSRRRWRMRIISQKVRALHTSWVRKLEDHLIREKLGPGLHLLENPDHGVIFLKDSISVFSCPKPLMWALDHFLHGVPRVQAGRSHGIAGPDFDALLQVLFQKSESKAKDDSRAPENNPEGTVLDRLVLNVSNACNLRCRYCYAGGGNYGRPDDLMTEATAAGVLEKFLGHFGRINRIQFFGGEPLLNPGLIQFVCKLIADKAKRGEIAEPPRFGLVTNGTILTPEIIDLLSRYSINVNVSLDGSTAVNDELRGRGTFDKVARFVDALECGGIDYAFEATYTAQHWKQGLSLCGLLDFFFDRFHVSELHIPPVCLPEGHPLALDPQVAARTYGDAVAYSLSNLRRGRRRVVLSFASRMMNAFLEARPLLPYCPAGSGTLSVDCRGGVYPCFMFTGIDDFCLGSIFEGSFLASPRSWEVLRRIAEKDKTNDSLCRTCWAFPFCSGCHGADYITGRGKLEKSLCDLNKAMAERFIKTVANLFDRPPGLSAEDSVIEGGDQPWASTFSACGDLG
jgi:uncharacterized protein